MKAWGTLLFLTVAGVILLAIGGALLLAPAAFFASNGIALADDPSLLSEIRAPGGLLAASGLLVLGGLVRPARQPQALALAVLVYGGIGLGRLVGMAADGMPATGIVAAAAIELVMAALGAAILFRHRKPAPAVPPPTAHAAVR